MFDRLLLPQFSLEKLRSQKSSVLLVDYSILDPRDPKSANHRLIVKSCYKKEHLSCSFF